MKSETNSINGQIDGLASKDVEMSFLFEAVKVEYE